MPTSYEQLQWDLEFDTLHNSVDLFTLTDYLSVSCGAQMQALLQRFNLLSVYRVLYFMISGNFYLLAS